jgi:hypothetical protein
VGYGLSVVPQNWQEDEDGAGHASRSSSLFRLKISQARVFQSGLKTARGVALVVHMASSRMLHRSEAKDGWFDGVGCAVALVGPNYLHFIVIFFLAHRGILVIWFSL